MQIFQRKHGTLDQGKRWEQWRLGADALPARKTVSSKRGWRSQDGDYAGVLSDLVVSLLKFQIYKFLLGPKWAILRLEKPKEWALGRWTNMKQEL